MKEDTKLCFSSFNSAIEIFFPFGGRQVYIKYIFDSECIKIQCEASA